MLRSLNYGTKDPIKTRVSFFTKKEFKVSLVRIAAHHHEIKKILKVINFLKRYGYHVALNIMQIADRSGQEIRSISRDVSKTSLDILYFADSMGSLDIKKILDIITNIKTHWKKNLGIHTHDNMSRAAINTNVAVTNGVDLVDGTITGMGRGPGNSKTEYLVIEYEKCCQKSKYNSSIKLIDKHFKPLKDKYKWGTNPLFLGWNTWYPSYIRSNYAWE